MDIPNYTLIEIELNSRPDDFDDRASVEVFSDFLRDRASVRLAPAYAIEQPSDGGEEPRGVARRVRAEGLPLSKPHITPFVERRAGASLLRASVGGVKPDQVGGGIRGVIAGFSVDARRRLMYLIAGVEREAVLPLFLTLTYPAIFPDPKTSKRHLDIFIKRLRRAFPGIGLIWKLEPQERGAPHYHIMTWGCDLKSLQEFVPLAWFDIAGGGDMKHLTWHRGGFDNQHCVQQVNSFRGVWNYAAKYLGKTFDVAGWSDKWTGRYWGVVNQENVPLGELVREEVTKKKAQELIRYMRRFQKSTKKSKKKKKYRSNKTRTQFCDADQWIEKILK